jgi:hypothetical protein
MAGYRINLDNDIHLPVPFDLLYCGRRATVNSPTLLRLTPDYADSQLLSNNEMRLYIKGVPEYEGRVLGSAQYGEIRKTDKGKIELWLDPRYVSPVAHGR